MTSPVFISYKPVGFGGCAKYDTMVGMDDETIVQEETLHEPHKHARPRILIGIGAVVVLVVVGALVWKEWGDDIEEVCFGDGEVCEVVLPDNI